MSTITPTGDQISTLNVTSFLIGDTVRDPSGRIGVIVTPQGLLPTFFAPGSTLPDGSIVPPGPGVVLNLPVPIPPLPVAIPAPPTTQNVQVNFNDGTIAVVPMNTLTLINRGNIGA